MDSYGLRENPKNLSKWFLENPDFFEISKHDTSLNSIHITYGRQNCGCKFFQWSYCLPDTLSSKLFV